MYCTYIGRHKITLVSLSTFKRLLVFSTFSEIVIIIRFFLGVDKGGREGEGRGLA